MNKLGIMQPYFLPYLGYFQLINAVDKYVLLDDVNFIMRGFINRNNILVGKSAHLFTIPVLKASQNKLINETKLNFQPKDKENFLKTIVHAYKKAPQFDEFYPILKEITDFDEDDLTLYIKNSIQKICLFIGINTEICLSSSIKKDECLHGEERIMEINKVLGANHYINPIGGVELYNREKFEQNGIKLNFIKMKEIIYPQFKNEFVPNLSIVDVLMFNSKDEVRELLNRYELI